DQLAPEYVQAVKGKTFPTAKVEPEFAPVRVGLARILAQAVEVRLPFGAAVSGADGFRQSGVEGVVGGDPEQLTRGIVDEVRQLLRFLARQQTAGLQTKLLLDLGDGGQVAEYDQGHAARINEIRACSKVKCQRIHRFRRAQGREAVAALLP